MVAKIYDKVLLVVAILLVVASVVLVGMLKQRFDPLLLSAPATPAQKGAYARVSVPVAEVKTEEWKDPSAQSDGPDWVYEVFTSPKIYYLPGPPPKFIAHAPTLVPIPPQPPFGLVFWQVKPDPFRLQLVGFVGQDGVFSNSQIGDPMDGQTFLARSGKELPELHLLIKSFEVKLLPMLDLPEGSTPIYEYAGVAVVEDTMTKEDTTLTTQSRLLNGRSYAMIKTVDGVALDPMKAGATIALPNGRKYKIDEVSDTPPVIKVTKTDDPDPVFKGPVTIELTPAPPPKAKGKRGSGAASPEKSVPVTAPAAGHAPTASIVEPRHIFAVNRVVRFGGPISLTGML